MAKHKDSSDRTRRVEVLKPHPENVKIYGDAEVADPDLVESISTLGILVPLLITVDDRIISGHRRWLAATRAGLKEVPVLVFPSTDPLEVLEAVVHTNKQRVKTNVQIAREAQAIVSIERERAKQRKDATRKRGDKGPDQETFPGRDKGQARDITGAQLGVSGKTVDKMLKVIEQIDSHLAEADRTEDEDDRESARSNAETLATELNRSVDRAHKLVTRQRGSPQARRAPALPGLWGRLLRDAEDVTEQAERLAHHPPEGLSEEQQRLGLETISNLVHRLSTARNQLVRGSDGE